MKTLLLYAPGLAGDPEEAAEGRTALAAASAPTLDRVARAARFGRMRAAPGRRRDDGHGLPLALVGVDPRREPVGRATLEALAHGVRLGRDDLALLVSLVGTLDGRVSDPRLDDLRADEGRALLAALAAQLGSSTLHWQQGERARHLLVVRGGAALQLAAATPGEVIGRRRIDQAPGGRDGARLAALAAAADDVLADHDVNGVRRELGEGAADAAWLWGPGRAAEVLPFELASRGRTLAVVGAGPIARGLARLVEAELVDVERRGRPAADGPAEARAAAAALGRHDAVLLATGGLDVPAEGADDRRRRAAIEALDRDVLAPLLAALAGRDDVRLLLVTDGELDGRAPFLLWGPGVESTRPRRFTEAAAEAGGLHVEDGFRMIEWVLAGAPPADRAGRDVAEAAG